MTEKISEPSQISKLNNRDNLKCSKSHGSFSVLSRNIECGSFSSIDVVKWRKPGITQRNLSALKVFSLGSLSRLQCVVYESDSRVKIQSGLFQVKREIKLLKRLRGAHQHIVQLERVSECRECNMILVSLRFAGRPIMYISESSEYHAWTAGSQKGLIFKPLVMNQMLTRSILRERDVVIVLDQLSSALMLLKERNIVHKDIKPANVLLNFPLCFWREISPGSAVRDVAWESNHHRPIEVTLCDFNIAEERHDGRIYDAQGTVLFSPPEVFGRIDPSQGVDGFQRDVWSMGVLAYCLLTGETPIAEAESSLMTQIHILRSTTESIHVPHFVENSRLRALIESLLNPDPSKRMTVERCAEELKHLD